MRGIFFDEDDARAAALALTRGGFEATVVRERLAGEDDDEDHPWAVLTDAPAIQLEVLVDMYDGWLDAETDTGTDPGTGPAVDPGPGPVRDGGDRPGAAGGLPLPDQPRRLKRPPAG
ncbi:hypothetical protein [Nocardioides sp. TF02-7]|uniref:hypothetical protein n=1 Tax=Nocardioides sp. TF02-7 TaxID=2917724 RepID=UPI001F06A007|nr:hypothetical protein [Nocardioides sp. TF02-7]UMG91470.1 hypothetical protein MF408_15215 [Nocardioides sp. TF02-7]